MGNFFIFCKHLLQLHKYKNNNSSKNFNMEFEIVSKKKFFASNILLITSLFIQIRLCPNMNIHIFQTVTQIYKYIHTSMCVCVRVYAQVKSQFSNLQTVRNILESNLVPTFFSNFNFNQSVLFQMWRNERIESAYCKLLVFWLVLLLCFSLFVWIILFGWTKHFKQDKRTIQETKSALQTDKCIQKLDTVYFFFYRTC